MHFQILQESTTPERISLLLSAFPVASHSPVRLTLCTFCKSTKDLKILVHAVPVGAIIDGNFRTLKITVLSCEDLRIDRRPVKENTFVVVRTEPINAFATKIDAEGGSYPFWDEKLVINMPLQERFITQDVYSHKNGAVASKNNRLVLSASMPATDFMGGYLPEDYLSILSYRLIGPKGQRNGVINFSVRAKLPENYASSKTKKMKEVAADESMYEKPKRAVTVAKAEKHFAGAVTGVPVWGASHGQFA